jgi:hypothetical protein
MPGPSALLGYQRCPHNAAERAFYEAARARGWEVSKRGWPDFFCIREGGEVALVEVKPHADRGLKTEQSAVLRALARYGVPCYRWSPDGGFQRVRAEG